MGRHYERPPMHQHIFQLACAVQPEAKTCSQSVRQRAQFRPAGFDFSLFFSSGWVKHIGAMFESLIIASYSGGKKKNNNITYHWYAYLAHNLAHAQHVIWHIH